MTSFAFRRVAYLFLALLVPLTLVGCGGGSPDSVVKDFMNALAAGKTDDAKKMLDLEGGPDAQMVDPMLGKMSGGLKGQGGIKSMEVVESTVNGDQATVKIKITTGDGKTDDSTFQLVNKNGWKIKDLK